MAAGHSGRWILHADMDAFYASVEQRDFPEIAGLPVVVGARSQRGVVAAASYEARRYGIRSAMPMREALKRCPDLICQPGRMSVYKEVSAGIFDIFRRYTPLVEGLSLDEAFLDVTDSRTLFGSATDIARAIKREVRGATSLNVSVGVAPNKLVAKIASDLDKPDGLTVIPPDAVRDRLAALDIAVLPGIGRKSQARLRRAGFNTIADLQTASDAALEKLFGNLAVRMRRRANGEDDRAVSSMRDDKSISAEETFAEDTSDRSLLARELMRLTDRTASRVRNANLAAGTVQVKIRRADFTTYTRQCALRPPTSDTDTLYQTARELLETWLDNNPMSLVRLLGVGCMNFSQGEQIDLFSAPDAPAASPVDRTVDSIRERFGGGALARARAIERSD